MFRRTLVTRAVFAALLAAGACVDDPTGAGGAVFLRRASGPEDSVLAGAPGQPLPAPVALRVLDGNGNPVARAIVHWSVVGGNGRVENVSGLSDEQGRVEAVWVLGTVAADSQRLAVEVQAGGRTAAATITAVAIPHEVSAVAFKDETTAVKLGVPTNLAIQAIDPFGNRFVVQNIRWTSLDTNLATVDSAGAVVVRKRGYVRLVAREASATDTAWVHGVQIVQSIVVDRDTVRIGAIGDSVMLAVRLLDDQGLPVPDSFPRLVPIDTAVVSARGGDSLLVRSVANGVVSMRLQVGGVAPDSPGSSTSRSTMSVAGPDSGTAPLTRQVVVVVSQVPAAMNVAVTFGNPVITLPAGAPLPLACDVRDKNGVVIPGQPALVRSIRGTVAGTGCGDARVARSGYDTLVFGAGSLQARVPVIVATRPDSIGVIAAARPLNTVDGEQFVGENLASPLILALRPLVAQIFAAYGNPATNLGRARAIRDWVARTAVILDPAIHPDGSTSNLSVLPPGTAWADVNPLSTAARWTEDRDYWGAQDYNGYVMLDRLLGTLDIGTGLRADDGLMEHVAGARYRIRDIQAYHYTLCTFQAIVANVLWAAAGLHGVRGATINHDPGVVFIPELGRWVYEDPTFNEEYLLDGVGDPLSPTDLLDLSLAGQAGRLRATKFPGPSFDPEPYATAWTYLQAGNPNGMLLMGGQLNGRVVDQGSAYAHYVQIDVPTLAMGLWPWSDPTIYHRVSAQDAFPTLGVTLAQVATEDSVYIATLSSTFPNHDHFERRTGGSWERVTAVDVLPVGAGRVEYRSVDALGNVGATTVLDVWVPRADGFLEAGAPGSPRTRATVVTVTGPAL